MEIRDRTNFSGTEPVQKLPNSAVVFYLGLMSMLFAWFYGFLSMVLAIIVLALYPAAAKEYEKFPDLYTRSSFHNLRLGRTFAIIGLILGVLSLIFSLVWFFFFGTFIFSLFKSFY